MTTNLENTDNNANRKLGPIRFWNPVLIIAASTYFLCAALSLAEEQEITIENVRTYHPFIGQDAGVGPEEPDASNGELPEQYQEQEPDETSLDESIEVVEDVEIEDENIFDKIRRNFAGSAQLDYLLVASDVEGRDKTFDGFTTELSLKLAVDVSDHFTASIKTCYTCHGFEIGMAYVDLRASDKFNVRVGRFSPAFGDFPVRHDPANHRTSDKPLPYDMGRMLRLREWNMGILPAPYVDNGITVFGTFDLGSAGFFDYAVYGIGGMRAFSGATDVDWLQSCSPTHYYIDNNSMPTAGGRLALGFFIGQNSSLKLGLSGMWGTYDPKNDLDILILGADLVFRYKAVTFRTEYLVRRTKMALGDNPEERFRYGPGKDGKFDPYFIKDSFYGETDFAVAKWLEFVARVDGLRRIGNVPVGSQLRSKSAILRYTGGVNFLLPYSFRVKLSGQFYDFSDFEDETVVHLGLVGAF